MYVIKYKDEKWTIYKNDKPLMLPCKLTKLKKVQFDTEEEACNYIRYVSKLISSDKNYLEIY